MYVLLKYDPEEDTGPFQDHVAAPFAGISIAAIAGTENEVLRLIVKNDTPGSQFHYEQIGA